MSALGRFVEHDPQSRQYPARRATQLKTVLWSHKAPVLDQGSLGSCTGNALAQCLNTTKFRLSRPNGRYLDESVARNLYSRATHLDSDPQYWPPTDTGSSGLAVAKAGMQLGYLTSYTHAFGMDHFLAAIQLSPVIIGSDWLEDMFNPSTKGWVNVSGNVAGGHEYLALGANMIGRYVTCLNSWGQGWGVNGRFRIHFDDFAKLLANQGDVTVPIGK
jgi:hypothetical protein